MAELYQQEKLQPSMLDRLTDDALVEVSREQLSHPESSEPRTVVAKDRFVINARKLRELVTRDLAWLLNTTSLEAVADLTNFPQVASSVLNYGTQGLNGMSLSNLDTRQLERHIKKVIINFEPRIIKETLNIKAIMREEMANRSLAFEIECDIWGQPAPEHLFIDSQVDLETGAFHFSQNAGVR